MMNAVSATEILYWRISQEAADLAVTVLLDSRTVQLSVLTTIVSNAPCIPTPAPRIPAPVPRRAPSITLKMTRQTREAALPRCVSKWMTAPLAARSAQEPAASRGGPSLPNWRPCTVT